MSGATDATDATPVFSALAPEIFKPKGRLSNRRLATGGFFGWTPQTPKTPAQGLFFKKAKGAGATGATGAVPTTES